MRRRLQHWGNSLAVRIPKVLATEAELTAGTEVDVSLEDGRLVLTPVTPPSFRLDELLDAVTNENVHREIAVGERVGNEAW